VTGNSSGLCDVSCEWSDAVMVGNKFIYAAQRTLERIIVIDVRDSLTPVEVSQSRIVARPPAKSSRKRRNLFTSSLHFLQMTPSTLLLLPLFLTM